MPEATAPELTAAEGEVPPAQAPAQALAQIGTPAPSAPALSREDELVRKKFAEYYARMAQRISVKAVAQREFGFGWRDKINVRHKAFSSQLELADFLRKETPLYASYSTAYYALPAARPMERKQYLGCDLAFDLDLIYEGQPKEKPHEHNKLLCEYCLQRSKEDAIRLVEEFLVADFGLSAGEVWMKFSGSKGYHVHVENDAVKELSQRARRQLISYVVGEGVDKLVARAGVEGSRAQVLRGPDKKSKGWRGRIFLEACEAIEKSSPEHLRELGLSPAKARKVFENKAFILNLLSQGNWDAVKGLEKLWDSIVRRAVAKHAVDVDRNVTLDEARLIRIPDTLHGDTALLAARVIKPSSFDPLKHAVAFKYGSLKIKPAVDARITLMGQVLEVKRDAATELPLQAALLLLCKKAASLP